GARHLDERHVLRLQPALLEELAESGQAVADPLRVVEPVDTEHDLLGVAELRADLPRARLDLRTPRERLVLLDIDRDREGACQNRAHEPASAARGDVAVRSGLRV